MAASSWAFNPQKIKCRTGLPALMVLGSLLLGLTGCHGKGASLSGSPAAQTSARAELSCARLISFSPSITEVVYALGLENQLVGVTRFCKYPLDAQKKSSVGGYLDPNLESVIRLRPTLVLLRQEQVDLRGNLANLQLPSFSVEHRSAAGILQSFRQIGQVCHREPQAEQLVAQLETEIHRIQQKTRRAKTRPRVLVVVDRDVRYGSIRQVYVAAHDQFYDWMLTQAGGQNAYPVEGQGFAEISTEGILRMNPDVILELLPSLAKHPQTPEALFRPWRGLERVSAVKTHRVYQLTEEYMGIPGPRFVRILDRFARILHPELDWSGRG